MYNNLIETVIAVKNIIKNDLTGHLSPFFDNLVYTKFNEIICLKVLEKKLILEDEYLNPESYIYESLAKKFNIEKSSDSLYEKVLTEGFNECQLYLPEIFFDDSITLSGFAVKKIIEALNSVNEWENDDIFGWCYQYYNEDLREDRIKKNNHKAFSQVYTPDWIVSYLVEKTFNIKINHDNTEIKDLKIIDPTCGSGHFLIKVFDKLLELYRDSGISDSISIKNIIENNIYGIDIDGRAVQITKIILKIKSLELGYKESLHFNLYSFSDLKDINLSLGTLIDSNIIADNFSDRNEDIFTILQQKFDIVLSNPPYTDSSDYDDELKKQIDRYYKDYRKNLYTCFIRRNYEFLKNNGVIGMITPQTFMFISSYKETRKFILDNTNIYDFVHFGLGGVFNDVLVDTAMYIFHKTDNKKLCRFIKLDDISGDEKRKELERLSNTISDKNIFFIEQEKFYKIEGYPFVYWINDEIRKIFEHQPLENYTDIRQGAATGDNKRFLRFNWEVLPETLSFNHKEDNKKWVPYSKGGPFNKWYGNLWWVINYSDENYPVLKKMGNHLPSEEYYFRRGLTYSMTTSKGSTFRYLPENFMFDCKGSSLFTKGNLSDFIILGLVNRKLFNYLYRFIAGSVDLEVGDLKNIPISEKCIEKGSKNELMKKLVKLNVLIKKQNTEISPIELHYKNSMIKK